MEDFVTFETAKKLKEKGFNWKVNAYYGKHENIFDVHPAMDMNDCEYRCSSPTISQVLKWLRDEKKLYLSIEPHLTDFSSTEIMWIWDALYINSDCKFQWHDGEFGFDSYEKAAVSAIEYVIDNLI